MVLNQGQCHGHEIGAVQRECLQVVCSLQVKVQLYLFCGTLRLVDMNLDRCRIDVSVAAGYPSQWENNSKGSPCGVLASRKNIHIEL